MLQYSYQIYHNNTSGQEERFCMSNPPLMCRVSESKICHIHYPNSKCSTFLTHSGKTVAHFIFR